MTALGDTGKTTRTRFWFDPRFAIGLALVVASVVGVYAIVASTDRTSAVYAARAGLAIGDKIDATDLVITRVRLGEAGELYLSPGRLPRAGLVVTRTVAAGELLPVSSVGTSAGVSVTSVVVDLQGKLAASIGPGSVVDVWAARQGEQGQFGPPVVLVAQASVVRIVDQASLIATDGAQSLEILVPKGKVAAVLESAANEDAVAVVPVNTAVGK